MPQPELNGQVATHLHRVLDVPCAEETSPAEGRVKRHDLKLVRRDGPLKERRQARKSNRSGLARSSVLVVLKPLKPYAGAELMNSFADLHIVLIRKKISVI